MLKRARLLCYLVLRVSRAVLLVVLGALSLMCVGWADRVDCRCFLSFVFLGTARCLELSPCNKRVKERSHTAEKQISMHLHKPHATSRPSRFPHTQTQYRLTPVVLTEMFTSAATSNHHHVESLTLDGLLTQLLYASVNLLVHIQARTA